MVKSRASDKILEELRDYGIALPGAHLKSPWPGHKDLAVNDKTFAYLTVEGEPFQISCKLPSSSAMALMLPFTKPTEYGLGKSGWVSASFEKHEPSLEMLKAWIDESYRAQAPKKLLKQLDGGGMPAPPAKPERKAAPKRATAAKTKRRA
ncbi:MAG: MmcQ/YjbR family DNA-binding protein [Deltaproteobacteria bacterium]